MAYPIIARSVPTLLSSARSLATKMFSSTPSIASKAAIRTGITGGSSRILNAMKNNKVTTALVLLEMGSEGLELLQEMAAQDAEVRDLIDRYGVTNDPVQDDTRGDLSTQVDEMQTITRAARAVGGLRNLHVLRRALALDEAHYKLYDELKVMSSVL